MMTRRQASVFWRKYTGSCRAARRKSRLAGNPRGAAVDARCIHRLCNNRCWCTRSVRRCCTRTSSRNEPRSGSPFFVSYLPRFSTEKKKGTPLNPIVTRSFDGGYPRRAFQIVLRKWFSFFARSSEIAFVSRWFHGRSLSTNLWIGTS